MIAFSHYTRRGDISGVSTWLLRLLLRLHRDGLPLRVLLHHVDSDLEHSELRDALAGAGVPVESEKWTFQTEDRVRSVLQFLQRHQPEVFVPQCIETSFHAAALAGDQGLPWIFTIHSDDLQYWHPFRQIRPERHGGRLLSVSEHLATECMNQGARRKPEVIPCGVRIGGVQAAFSNERFRVVFAGRVEERQKRISLVLEVLVQACLLEPKLEGLIIGDGPQLDQCRAWVLERGLGQRIRFTGRLDPEGVAEELAQAQGFLMMSDYEGLPVALLEAMSAGVVPVARLIQSGIPELVENEVTGLLVDDRPPAAAAALARLARDPELWSRCSQAAVKRVNSGYNEDLCHAKWKALIVETRQSGRMNHPLRIPGRIRLPLPHPLLQGCDVQKLTLVQRLRRKLRRFS